MVLWIFLLFVLFTCLWFSFCTAPLRLRIVCFYLFYLMLFRFRICIVCKVVDNKFRKRRLNVIVTGAGGASSPKSGLLTRTSSWFHFSCLQHTYTALCSIFSYSIVKLILLVLSPLFQHKGQIWEGLIWMESCWLCLTTFSSETSLTAFSSEYTLYSKTNLEAFSN